MICTTCGAATSSVIDTRRGAFNTTVRRRQCPLGHRFTTREVHEPVWCSAKQRAKTFAATVATRIKLRERDMIIAQALHRGWRAMADRYSIDKSAIYLAAERGRRHLKELAKR